MSLSEALASPAADPGDALRLTGRAGRMPLPLSVRSLGSGEVEQAAKGEVGTPASPLVRITARHRRMAELVADGYGTNEVALMVGLTPSRVSSIKADHAFQELVEHAKTHKEAAFIKTNERLAAVANSSLDEIQDRFDEDPAQFSVKELLSIAELGADRTGYGPKKTEEKNVNINFGDALAQARKRAHEARQIEAKVTNDVVTLEAAE